jgi:GxxExxY protein
VETQKPITIFCDGENVGEFVADVIVEDIIIVDLKSVKEIAKVHEAQLVNYLVATGKPVGLIINFDEYKVEIRLKVRSLKHSKLSKNKN